MIKVQICSELIFASRACAEERDRALLPKRFVFGRFYKPGPTGSKAAGRE